MTGNDIGKRLRTTRLDAGFKSAREAAARFGWNENTYRSHENASRGVPRSALVHYARAYRVPIAWLLTGVEDATTRSTGEGVVVPLIDWNDLPME